VRVADRGVAGHGGEEAADVTGDLCPVARRPEGHALLDAVQMLDHSLKTLRLELAQRRLGHRSPRLLGHLGARCVVLRALRKNAEARRDDGRHVGIARYHLVRLEDAHAPLLREQAVGVLGELELL